MSLGSMELVVFMLQVKRRERGLGSFPSSLSLSFGSPDVLLEEQGTGRERREKFHSAQKRRHTQTLRGQNSVLHKTAYFADYHQASAKAHAILLLQRVAPGCPLFDFVNNFHLK